MVMRGALILRVVCEIQRRRASLFAIADGLRRSDEPLAA
jgi:hypothetical protein